MGVVKFFVVVFLFLNLLAIVIDGFIFYFILLSNSGYYSELLLQVGKHLPYQAAKLHGFKFLS